MGSLVGLMTVLALIYVSLHEAHHCQYHVTFLAKYTSHMYKCLTLEEKNRWEAHAAQDKARYEAEMTTYVPPPGYDATGNLVEDRKFEANFFAGNLWSFHHFR